MDSESTRYARQIQFAPIGQEGQEKIGQATVSILGCGALGTVAAEILARSGVGHLRIIDRDVVEWTNLQRQSLFEEQDAHDGRSKSDAACQRLAKINSEIELQPIVADVTSGNIDAILMGSDLIIDAADNFLIRFLLNDWSLKTNTAWVHGGCVGATGQVILFTGAGSPCFRCLVPEPPPASSVDTCDTAGVIGAATHFIASLQSTEAIKWLSGNQGAVDQTLLSVDLWNNRIRNLKLSPTISKDCVACGRRTYEFLEGSRALSGESAAVLCGRDAVQISRPSENDIDLLRYGQRWESVGRVQTTPFFVRLFPDDDHSVTLFRDGRVVITGTSEIAEARTLCDRYVGG
ncbi:MAG: ThiF family adenylyltransferase [Planctomycetota bacterium]